MAERLPISLPEVYRRVNNIEDPVKRAGAQAFSGVYAPALRLPDYTRSSLNRTIMRHRALRAKEFAINEAETEFGLNISPTSETFDLQAIDQVAQQAGLMGIDILGISSRARNVLYRSQIKDLVTLNQMTTDELFGLRNAGVKSVKEIQEGLRGIKSITPEEAEDRIKGIFAEQEEYAQQQLERQRREKGKTIQEAAEAVSEAGSQLSDDTLLDALYTGPNRDFTLEIPQEWASAIKKLVPAQKGVLNVTLTVAMSHHNIRNIRSVGEIRKMSAEELKDIVGPTRAMFFQKAFGMSSNPLV